MVSSCHMRRVLWRMPNARVLASILKPRETTSDDAHKHTLMQNPFGQKGLLGGNQNNKVPCVVCALVCSALLLCKSFCMQLFGGPQNHLCNMSPVCSTPLHCESPFERNVNSELANFPVKHAFRCEEDALEHPQMLFVAIRGCFFTPWGVKNILIRCSSSNIRAREFSYRKTPIVWWSFFEAAVKNSSKKASVPNLGSTCSVILYLHACKLPSHPSNQGCAMWRAETQAHRGGRGAEPRRRKPAILSTEGGVGPLKERSMPGKVAALQATGCVAVPVPVNPLVANVREERATMEGH